jgi:hypothetical protein
MKTLDVIFRADRYGDHAGEVTAVFPTEAATCDVSAVLSYAHVGQHGACSRAWYVYATRAATPDEYAPLLRELQGIYEPEVTLRVVKRWTAAHDKART